MTKEDGKGKGQEENFAELLEGYLPPSHVLAIKRDTDNPQIGIAFNLFGEGLRQREEGDISAARDSFKAVLSAPGRPGKLTYLALKNLAGITYETLRKTADKEEKFRLIGTIYSLYDRMADVPYNDPLPQSRVQSAILLVRTEIAHVNLLDSPEEKRNLLLQAHDTLTQVKDSLPNDRPNLSFTFYSTWTHIARIMLRLSKGNKEKRRWAELQLNESETVLKNISKPEEKAFYLESCASALIKLSETLRNREIRLGHLSRAYDYMAQSLDCKRRGPR